MKILFWLLLIGVSLFVLGLFSSLLSGLRHRRDAEGREALPPPSFEARSPLEGRQAELFVRLCETYPRKRVLCDVPYHRFLVADDGTSLDGVAPLLICDETLRPEMVVVWDEAAVPEETLSSAGITHRRVDPDDIMVEL